MPDEQKITKEICLMKVTRTPEGVEVYIKSPKAEEYFYTISQGQTTTTNTQQDWYTNRLVYQPIAMGSFAAPWTSLAGLFTGHTNPTLFYLRIVGIKNGITIKIPGVHSKEKIKRFIEREKGNLVEFFKEYIKTYNVTLSISEDNNHATS